MVLKLPLQPVFLVKLVSCLYLRPEAYPRVAITAYLNVHRYLG
jgi:hypothetical protein